MSSENPQKEERTLAVAASELILSEQTASMLSFIPKDDIVILAARLWPIFPQPAESKFRLSQIEVYHVTEMAMAYGCHPLAINREYYAFKDKKGRIIVIPHYGKDVAWAKSVEDFDDFYIEWSREEKEASLVVDVDDVIYDCVLVPASRKGDFKDIYSAVYASLIEKLSHDEADQKAVRAASKFGTVRSGRVERSEIYYDDGNVRYGSGGKITGWIPGHDRAKVRALRNAIKSYYGVPTPEQYRSVGHDTTSPVIVEAMAEMPDQIVATPDYVQKRYTEIAEMMDEIDKMSLEELREGREDRIDLLRGEKVPDNWLDEPVPPEAEEEALVSEALVDGEYSIGQVKMALLELGFSDYATQTEELVSRFGPNTTFNDLSQDQMAQIIRGTEDDEQQTDE